MDMIDFWVFASQTELKSGILDFGLKQASHDHFHDCGI